MVKYVIMKLSMTGALGYIIWGQDIMIRKTEDF